ncbi:hypothetical protein RJZ56_007536 [Blastomyces dermatitidis]|nr:uncharacterized protein BDCG_09389 [Blastomyces dermatitidis ER-3]XP_045282922.1 hypothetical protein, variant [Blastomyces dermatitidis ER-3]EEQ86120.1 hypothetical protein BDCG_09389 [Blastomyces dermatitidis ER-3]KMW68459.1 hypothetical protein BDDG_12837 [Blastomyces dermatitidis ATCC 18188]OAT03195.1 hypothetical protein, variant [Blastomyces dermatitidis ER-3]
MTDKSEPDQAKKGKEAMVGMKADVKTLQLLSSSAKAAIDKREKIKNEKAKLALEEAIHIALREQNQTGSSKETGQ